MTDIPTKMRRIVTEAKSGGTLEVRLDETDTPKPGPGTRQGPTRESPAGEPRPFASR